MRLFEVDSLSQQFKVKLSESRTQSHTVFLQLGPELSTTQASCCGSLPSDKIYHPKVSVRMQVILYWYFVVLERKRDETGVKCHGTSGGANSALFAEPISLCVAGAGDEGVRGDPLIRTNE
jgi:hypothetical protein